METENLVKISAKSPRPVAERLLAIDPRKIVIGGLDEPLATVDPLYDERATLSDEDAEIPALVQSMLTSDEPVVVQGVMRDRRIYVSQGRRRTRAARAAWATREANGLPPPAFFVITRTGDADALATSALVENFGRLNDPPVMLARKFKRLIETREWDERRLANLTGQTVQSIRNTLSLLKLDESVQREIESGRVGPTVGYELAKLSAEAQNAALATMRDRAASNGGKIRAIDARVAVARARGETVDDDAVTGEIVSSDGGDDPAFREIGEDDVRAGKPAKPARARNGATGPKYEPISSGALRRLVRAVEEDGTLDESDPDLARLQRADPWALLRVIAGDLHPSRAPGLMACLKFIGVKIAE